MIENLEPSMRWMLAHEGGYVNHPKDPGGATNMGVTQRVYDFYRRGRGLPQQSVRGISADEVSAIYKKQYWDAVRGDELPSGIDYAVFDFAVNSGTKRAAMELQKVLGVTSDGIIGMQTLAAAQDADPFDVIERLCQNRMAFLRRLKHWGTFGRGWASRVMGVKDGAQRDDIGVIDRAILLAGHSPKTEHLPDPVSVGSGKGETPRRAGMMSSTTLQAVGVQAAGYAGAGWAAFQQLEGVTQAVVLGAVSAGLLMALWIARERVRKWLDGDQ